MSRKYTRPLSNLDFTKAPVGKAKVYTGLRSKNTSNEVTFEGTEEERFTKASAGKEIKAKVYTGVRRKNASNVSNEGRKEDESLEGYRVIGYKVIGQWS